MSFPTTESQSMERVSPRMTGTAWVWLFDATVFAIPPRHEHDLLVSLLCVMLALYETRIWSPDSASAPPGSAPGG